MEPNDQLEESQTLSSSIHPAEEDVELYEDVEDKKDFSIRITLMLITALTLIGATAFYVSKYTHPEQDRVSLLDSIFTQDTQSDASTSTVADVLEQQNQDNLARRDLIAQSSSSTRASSTALSAVTLNSDTFAPVPKKTSSNLNGATSKNIITEYIIRATSSNSFATTTRVDVLSVTTVSKDLGVSFKVDPYWQVTPKWNTPYPTVRIAKVGPRATDVITMTRFSGTSVSTEDSINGNVMYYYDSNTQLWMTLNYTNSMPINKSLSATSFTPTSFTVNQKPIFKGTTAAKTLIVAPNTNDFIIVNISGSGYSSILDEFVKNIR